MKAIFKLTFVVSLSLASAVIFAQKSADELVEEVNQIAKTRGKVEAVRALQAEEKNVRYENPQEYAKQQLAQTKAGLQKAGQHVPTDEVLLKELEERANGMNLNSRYNILTTKSWLLVDVGREKEAVKAMDDFILTLTPGSNPFKVVSIVRNRIAIMHNTAPALVVDQKYGDFTSLADWKGKVVVIDAFAHWCQPCKEELKDIRRMYDDLHGKGLEVVSVTGLYGYYNAENRDKKDMDSVTEYARMGDFVKKYNMNWPVVIAEDGDNNPNFKALGVTGLPMVILVDRQGKVQELHIGYTPEQFKEFRAKVEKALGGS